MKLSKRTFCQMYNEYYGEDLREFVEHCISVKETSQLERLRGFSFKLFRERKSYLLKQKVAILLFFLGFKHSATMFIDENTVMFGYGKCYDIGVFEYDLPAKYAKTRQKDLS